MKTLDTLTLEPGTPVLLRVDINEPVDRHGFPLVKEEQDMI